ncbi:hypothetical protein HMPREF0044_1183 [Gleimia coleocanis DSM 15436]|uniref:ABC transporter domain-containing protein n=1 Tax=Gleimia coleocanis DSM 15436 TaxID=525245 RepID=C0W193_9ACTO|nr:ATP-binding cassette domain-containing protein [Gleimia coleocanis]EEH63582.1 hypothetical protein HMPREF0044_1183 [Gleimia coleocanis DSM 15436]
MKTLINAKALTLAGKTRPVFGPLSLSIPTGKLCLISGEQSSGKSSLLLALTGRFNGLEGELTINGIDATEHPLQVLEHTSVAQLGNYLTAEDRLTINEAIYDRAFIDNMSPRKAKQRFSELEELIGLKLNRNTQLNEYDLLTQRWVSVALAILRPAKVTILDDADQGLTPTQAAELYRILQNIAEHEEMAIIVSGFHAGAVPQGTLLLNLEGNKQHPREYEKATNPELSQQESAPQINDPLAEPADSTEAAEEKEEN